MRNPTSAVAAAAAIAAATLSGCAAIDEVSGLMANAVGVDPRVMALSPVVQPLGFGVETNRTGGAGGLLITRNVAGVNVAAGFSLAEAKVVNVVVAGIVVPLDDSGQLQMDNATRARLLDKGVPGPVIVKIEEVVNQLVRATRRA